MHAQSTKINRTHIGMDDPESAAGRAIKAALAASTPNPTFDRSYKSNVEQMLQAAITSILNDFKRVLSKKDEQHEREIADLKKQLQLLEQRDLAVQPTPHSQPSWARITSGALSTKFTEVQNEQLNAHADEMSEREKRACNVIIFGMPSTGKDQPQRSTADTSAVQNVLHEALKTKVSISKIRRLPGPDRNFTGPLIVTLGSTAERASLLRVAKHLKDHETYSKVYIHADETIAQQQRSKALRAECKRLSAAEGERYVIRSNTVVKLRLPRASAMNDGPSSNQ